MSNSIATLIQASLAIGLGSKKLREPAAFADTSYGRFQNDAKLPPTLLNPVVSPNYSYELIGKLNEILKVSCAVTD